jgi:hypothetical protein
MSFPSQGGLRQDNLSDAWQRARQLARTIKDSAQAVQNASLAGTLTSSQMFTLTTLIADCKVQLTSISGITGIGSYAQAQIGDNTINVATEFSNMIAAMDGIVSWVASNFPKDGSNFLLAYTLSAQGRLVDRVFSAAATAVLRTQLNALISTID